MTNTIEFEYYYHTIIEWFLLSFFGLKFLLSVVWYKNNTSGSINITLSH